MAQEHIKHWQIGDVQVTRLVEVNAHQDPFTMLSTECEPDMAKHFPWLMPNFATPQGIMKISFQAFAMKTPEKTIIVDTCIGEGRVREFEIFTHMQSDYLEDLAAAGYDPDAADVVLCTHLHFDHVGWNTRERNGRWVPTFPNARYVFSKTDRDYFDPARGDGGKIDAHARVFNDSVLPILEAKQEMLVDDTMALGDDLTIEPAPGHSPGHVLIALKSQGAEALFTGDIMHNPIQIHHPHWSSAFCSDPDEARRTRRRLLERAAARGSLLYPAHFAGPHIGRVAEAAGGFKYLPGQGQA